MNTVRQVAKGIISCNQQRYSNDLLAVIPDDVLDITLDDDILLQVGSQLDDIRFEKKTTLSEMTGTSGDALVAVLNSQLGTLPDDQEKVRVEINFLFNVAATVIHQ